MGVFASPFVQPKTARLDLGDGHWIDIKQELSYGDTQEFVSRSRVDVTTASLHMVAAFLVDWSLVNAEGQPVPVEQEAQKIAALRALSGEAFAAIEKAIDAHVKETQAAKKAEAPSGRKKSARPSA